MLASKVLRHKKPRLRILVSFVQDLGRGSSLAAADILIQEGISAEVIDVFSVKPFDEYAILASAAKTGRVVSVKEHNVATGLGAAAAELLAEKLPTPIRFAGMRTFGTSASGDVLLSHFHLDAEGIAGRVREFVLA